jgi:hypothetical protein
MAPKNFRKTTIVSLLPYQLHESKPTLYPSEYVIPAVGLGEEIQTLVIDDADSLVYLDSERGSLRVKTSSEEIAQSIIQDYTRSVLAYGDNCRPGLFYLSGDWNSTEILKAQPEELIKAKEFQHNWLVALVRIADDDWSKFHQHKMISDIQRLAAKTLNLNRDWITVVPDEAQLCPMCRTRVDPLAVLCMNCKFVLNEEKYAQYRKRFAGELANVSTG